MNFQEYITNKKIDAAAFGHHEPERFEEWAHLFAQLHPESFTAQKKFLLNDLRKKYPKPKDA